LLCTARRSSGVRLNVFVFTFSLAKIPRL
jgi:hypothetical protein